MSSDGPSAAQTYCVSATVVSVALERQAIGRFLTIPGYCLPCDSAKTLCHEILLIGHTVGA